MDNEPNFGDLPNGAQFRFFKHGSLLTKTGARTYDAPQWCQFGITTDPEKKVIPAAPSTLAPHP